MDGDFPWILAGAFLLWLFNAIGGRKRPPGQRTELPRDPSPPRRVARRPEPARSGLDTTQTEGGQLEELLRALEQRLDPTAAEPALPPPRSRPPQPARGPLGRPAKVPLPAAEELEERESLEVDPVVESLEREIRRPERVNPNRLAQAEAKERARLSEAEARDREPHKARHASFDKRIRTPPVAEPAARRLTTAQIRQAFIWGEILGRPKGG
ncbi:MAG TPA: hypothetical protein VFM14_06845 [Gemmatimonadales bacterium]|nr:hypothetical protein [Gemmatimonadales bacterium]